MWIFQYKELVFGLIFSSLLTIPYYFLLKVERFRIVEYQHVSIFFILWAAVFTLEYYIFGPASYISLESDGRFFTFLYFLANNFNGIRFSHEIAGGQDVWSIMTGLQYFQLERLLLKILDPWIVLFLHKLMVGALGFFGSYLLARQFDGDNRAISVAVASIFPVSHLYLLDYSVEFSTGFAAISWGVYACTVKTKEKDFIFWTIIAAIILAPAPPAKVFPALILSTVGFAILRPHINYLKAAAGLLFIIIVSILNWHEVLYAYFKINPFASRGMGSAPSIVTFAEVLADSFTVMKTLWFKINWWVPTLLFSASIIILVVVRDRFYLKALGAIAWLSGAIIFVNVFPWQIIGMGYMKALEHGNMQMALAILAVPITSRALERLEQRVSAPFIRPEVAILAIAMAILSWNKYLHASQYIAFGGQNNRLEYRDLKSPTWKAANDYRVVTPFDTPRPNVVAGYYGIDSFDGGSFLQPKKWNDYWNSIRRQSAFEGPGASRTAARIRPDWRFLDGETYDIAGHISLDLLRIANVRYILSAMPLIGNGLSLIVTPGLDEHIRTPKSMFASKANYILYRIRRIFDPGRHFIYELSNPLPKLFVAQGLKTVANNISIESLHDNVKASALSRIIIVSEKDGLVSSGIHKFKILSIKKVSDGYDLTVDAPNGGILVLNNNYLPFWKAYADGQLLTITPANAIHMAITLPPGAQKIKIRYSRPLLREKIVEFFN